MDPAPQSEASLTPQHRFVDYFYQAGLPPSSTLESRRIAPQSQEADTAAPAQVVHGEEDTCVKSNENPTRTPLEARPESPFDGEGIMRLGGHFSLPHPLEDRYEASILCRYPNTDYADTAFPTYLSMFLFPDDLKLAHSVAGPPEETYHSFIVTEENGNRAYGMCVVMYDRPSPAQASEIDEMFLEWRTKALVQADLEYIQHLQSQLAQIQETILHARQNPRSPPQTPRSATSPAPDTVADAEEKVALYTDLLRPMRDTVLASVDNVYVPRVIGVLSRWPWYDLLRDWLCALICTLRGEKSSGGAELGLGIPMERWVVNLVREVPVPPPGKLELCIAVGKARLFCSRPPVNTSSLLQNFSLYPFFRCLSPSHIVTIFELALTERKLIFLSSHTALLNLAVESLCLLMYPLSWQHILIPVLPAKLLSYLQAPMPYIVGVRRDYFTVERANEWKPTDACVVDLDSDTLEMNEVGPVPMLPARDRRKLVTRIAKYAQCASWTQIVSAGLAPGSTINPNGGPVVRYKMRGPPISTIFALPGGKRVLAPSTATSAVAVRSNGTEKHTGKAKSFGDSLNKVKHGWAENTGPAGFLRLGTGKVVNIGESGGGGLFVSIQSLASSTTSSGPGGVVVNEEEEQTAGGGGLSSSQSPFSVSKWIGQQQQRARRQRGDGGEGEPSNSPGKTENEMEESTIVGDRSEAGSVGSSPFSVQFKKMFSRSSANESATLSISTNATGSTSLQNSPSASSFASIFTNLTSPAALNRGPKDSSFTPTTRQRQRSSQLPTSSTIPEEHGHKKSNRASMKISFQRGPLVSFQTQNTLWKQQSTTGSWSTSSETEGGIGTGTATTKAENSGSIEFGVPNVYSREGHILHECVGDTMTLAREVDIDGVAGLGHGKEGEGRQIMTQDGSSWALSPSTAGTQLAPLGSRECEGCRVGSTCSLCQEDHSDHEKHWRCSTCHLVIHASCIPLLDARPCPGSFDESKIRRAFLKVFTSLLKCYRQYLVIPDAIQQLRELENRGGLRPDVLKSSGGAPNVSDLVQDDWFKRQEYLNSLDKEGVAFMTHVVETQSFAQFTLDRIERPESDYDVLFFDESIKAKLNRSRLKITKDSTPFLKDGSFRVQQTFYVLPPNTDDLTGEEVSSQRGTVPLELDERLLCPPRVVQSLITETDSHIMRSHTFELVQKARMSSMKRKQDVSKWMRSKWKHFQKIGNGQIVGIGFLSDEQRREMFEQRLAQVSDVIDGYEATHLSSQPAEEVLDALRHLQEQHLVLLHAVDEEQLVESSEQEDLQKMYMRLFRVITIYQDHLMSLGYDASAIAEVMNAVSANVSNRTSMLEIFKDGHPASSRASSLSRDASGSIKASARSTQSSIRVTIHGRTASSLAALYEVHTEEIDSPSDHVPLYLLRQQARSTTKLQNGVTESADVPSDTHQDNQQLRMHSASTSPDDSPRASTTQVKQRKASTTSPHEPTPPKSPPPQHLGRPTRPLPVVPRKSFTMPGQEEIKENREHQASRDAFAAQ